MLRRKGRAIDPVIVARVARRYRKLGSVTKTAAWFNESYAAIYRLLKIRGWLIPPNRPSRRWFNDRSYVKNNNGFWICNSTKPAIMLHREIWKHTNGVIPRGCIIQFKDDDRDNCALENLQCILKPRPRNKWDEWKAGKRLRRPVDKSLQARNEASRSFWRSMSIEEREMYCLLRGWVSQENKRAQGNSRKRSQRFFQLMAAAGALK